MYGGSLLSMLTDFQKWVDPAHADGFIYANRRGRYGHCSAQDQFCIDFILGKEAHMLALVKSF